MFSIYRIKLIIILIVLIVNFERCNCVKNDDFDTFKNVINNGVLKYIVKHVTLFEDNPECLSDILFWNNSFPNYDWASRMSDSQGKIPAGILTGNINSLGNYDECLEIGFENAGRNVMGKYCLLKHPVFISENSSMSILNAESLTGRIGNFDRYERFSFNFAICVPSSCKSSDIENILNDITNATDLLTISENECSTSTPLEWTVADWVAVGIYSLFVLLLISSTAFDLYVHKLSKGPYQYQSILSSFSIYSNTKHLTKYDANPKNVPCINGVRVLSMFWIIIGHRYSTAVKFPMLNTIDALEWSNKYEAMMIVGGSLSVDTFLVLSGMLISYLFFKQREKRRYFNLPLFYLHRFLRLTPVLGAMILFHATLYKFIGNGPLWYTMDEFAIKACQKYWWTALLYVQNYVNPLRMCVAQSWYLCVDTQLYLLSPILLYPLMKSKLFGMANVGLWILTSQIAVIIIVFINKWPAAATTADIGYLTNYYYATHMRATPWLLGFAAGYLVYNTSKTDVKLNKIVVILSWIICLTILGSVVFGMKPLQETSHVYSNFQDSAYNALARTVWSFSIIWIIIACNLGYGGPINWLLSLNIWEILARLTYCMYIIHPWVQFTMLTTQKTIREFSNTEFVFNFFGDLTFTILISYVWMMAFESPFIALEKAIFYQKRVKIRGSTEA